jgi:hypothetical protein
MDTFEILKSYDWGDEWDSIDDIEGILPSVLQSVSGVVFIFFLKEQVNTIEGDQYDLYLTRSYDWGDTWEEPELIIENVVKAQVSAIEMFDKVILLAFWQDDEGEDKNFVTKSFDEGDTWETPVEV